MFDWRLKLDVGWVMLFISLHSLTQDTYWRPTCRACPSSSPSQVNCAPCALCRPSVLHRDDGGGACLISFINAGKLCPRANSLCYSGDLWVFLRVAVLLLWLFIVYMKRNSWSNFWAVCHESWTSNNPNPADRERERFCSALMWAACCVVD